MYDGVAEYDGVAVCEHSGLTWAYASSFVRLSGTKDRDTACAVCTLRAALRKRVLGPAFGLGLEGSLPSSGCDWFLGANIKPAFCSSSEGDDRCSMAAATCTITCLPARRARAAAGTAEPFPEFVACRYEAVRGRGFLAVLCQAVHRLPRELRGYHRGSGPRSVGCGGMRRAGNCYAGCESNINYLMMAQIIRISSM